MIANVRIGGRVFTTLDGLGTVVDIMYTDLRTLRHGLFSSEIKEVEVEFDNGITKFVLAAALTIH